VISLPQGLHGAYHRSELEEHLGFHGLRSALREGRLVRFGRQVMVVRQHMLDFRTRCAATLLLAGPRAMLARETSAHLHGCTAAGTGSVHVLLPYEVPLDPRGGITIHRSRFDEAEVTVIDGLRCQPLTAALSDLLCRSDRYTALACTDQALSWLTPDERADAKDELARHVARRADNRGTRRAEFLLMLTTGLPESPPESHLLLKIVDAGLPMPELQFVVRDLDGRAIWRLDYAWPSVRLALEYDGYAAHVDRREEDLARDEDLRRRGWTVIRADVSDLRNPTRLFNALKAGLAAPNLRLARLEPATRAS
jgi:Protein of unknown function (DUF559)